jgi:hypothetical protein
MLAELHFIALTSQRNKQNEDDHHGHPKILFMDVRRPQREQQNQEISYLKNEHQIKVHSIQDH